MVVRHALNYVFFEREGFCRPEGLWCDIDGTPWPIADSDAVDRFRPWDEDDEA